MKYFFLAFSFLFFHTFLNAQEQNTDEQATKGNANEETTTFYVVEQMPLYKGCEELPKNESEQCTTQKILRFMSTHVEYPVIALENSIQGIVYVEFTINRSGKVMDVDVVRSKHPALDSEAVRVVKRLPPFIPGRQDGKPVNVRYRLPVNFRLN